jgi:hypothetical protein
MRGQGHGRGAGEAPFPPAWRAEDPQRPARRRHVERHEGQRAARPRAAAAAAGRAQHVVLRREDEARALHLEKGGGAVKT